MDPIIQYRSEEGELLSLGSAAKEGSLSDLESPGCTFGCHREKASSSSCSHGPPTCGGWPLRPRMAPGRLLELVLSHAEVGACAVAGERATLLDAAALIHAHHQAVSKEETR